MPNDRPLGRDVVLFHGDQALQTYGDTHRGANWPSAADRLTRFDVMLDVMMAMPTARTVFCDLGCGTGELLRHIRERRIPNIDYIGVDRSELALGHARGKFPGAQFLALDVCDSNSDVSQIACDYLCINGVFTVRWELDEADMWSFVEETVRAVWPHVRKGLAFNVMSKIVDWERDDLFHVPMDRTARLLHALAGRHVMIRADYGLYEYTAYAFRGAPRFTFVTAPASSDPAADSATTSMKGQEK